MMKTLVLFALAGLAMSAPAEDPAGPHKMVKLAHAVDVFGLNLLEHLERAEPRDKTPKNLLISPLSISSVLSTLLAGSAHETNKQIYRALGYEHEHLTEKEIIHEMMELRHGLNHQLKDTKNQLHIADAVAIEKGYPVLESFHEVLKDQTLMAKNFHHEAHRATEEINEWVKEHTHHKIPKLFGEDLSADTVMVLLNAIYFKGLWKKPFETKNTKREAFHYRGKEGKRETEHVEMMYMHGKFGHAHFEDGDLLEIPYQNDSVSFFAFLPHEKHVDEISISSLFGSSANQDSLKFSERMARVHPHRSVNVHLPKFKIESKHSLNSALRHVGMHEAFVRGQADFSRINGKHDLFVSNVLHKAFIEVNEEGSEAAAATGVVIETTSVQLPVHFNANRPFFFMIYDHKYQLALFTGVVNKP